MALTVATTNSLGEALGSTLPLLTSTEAGARFDQPTLSTMSADQRLLAWTLQAWPSESLQQWHDVVGLEPTATTGPLRATALRSATAVALWHLIEERSDDEPFEASLAALRLWFEGLFPLALTEPEKVLELPNPHVQHTLGLVLGMLAWRGFRTAPELVRGCLASDADAAELRRGLLVGLAGCDEGKIVDALLNAMRSSLVERDGWRRAVYQTLPWGRGADMGQEATLNLAEALLLSSSSEAEVSRCIRGLLGHSNAIPSARHWLDARWNQWPAHVRAALITHEVVSTDQERCFRDRSPEVLLAAIETFDGPLSTATTERLRSLLQHHSASVRSAVSIRLAQARTPSAVGEAVSSNNASVVALPPATLARTTLDRIRAAYVLDEPESVPGLVKGLPP